ncbi:hypothetical protein KAR91_88440 [Candidatus Pacearchaeota archaeon]|nr:hypothetical protein [Candidatus Pacearchaeota archaeon]
MGKRKDFKKGQMWYLTSGAHFTIIMIEEGEPSNLKQKIHGKLHYGSGDIEPKIFTRAELEFKAKNLCIEGEPLYLGKYTTTPYIGEKSLEEILQISQDHPIDN